MSSPAEHAVVVGAGPAGLAATVAAARGGVRVTLLDAAPRPGGQYWRHGPAGPGAGHRDVGTFTGLWRRIRTLQAAGRVTYRPGHHVWTLHVDDDGCTVHALAGDTEATLLADHLVLAAGAYDRQVPFPGWDLPGVLTAGGAQSLLKGSGVAVGPRVLVAGTGPFLLPVATGLAAHGAHVLGVLEANHPAGWLRQLPAVAAHPAAVAEAAGYAAVLARRRIPLHHRTVVVAAHGRDRLEAVTVGRPGAPEHDRRIELDVLAVGYGFTAQTELPLQAGCALHVTPDGSAAVTTDGDQRTSRARVFAAGEATGVGGARLAVAEGTVAGSCLAGRATGARRTRDRLRRFAAGLHAVYPVPAAWLDHLTPDTVVCRCEEVTVAAVDAAIGLGARDTRTVKLLSRSGMGWCQGRQCAYATGVLTAHRTGRPADPLAGTDRPVAVPIPLGLVAAPAPPTEEQT